jgi:hypothetical protein
MNLAPTPSLSALVPLSRCYSLPAMQTPKGTIALVLTSGEPALLTQTDGDKTSLEVPKAFPHGSTVSGQIRDSEFCIEVKVFRCQRVGAVFRVDGRIKNVSRALKATLLERLAQTDNSDASTQSARIDAPTDSPK